MRPLFRYSVVALWALAALICSCDDAAERVFGEKSFDVIAEMKRVTWPDFPQVRQATIAIIIFVLILGLVITILDFVLQGVLIKMIPSLFAGR